MAAGKDARSRLTFFAFILSRHIFDGFFCLFIYKKIILQFRFTQYCLFKISFGFIILLKNLLLKYSNVKYMQKFLFFSLIMIFVFNRTQCQISIPNTVTAYKTVDKIKIDGVLDEDVWKQAQRITNFTQREMHEGEPATQRTECAVVFDNENIYIAAWCYDTESENLTAKFMQRDFEYWLDDNFEIIFDTFQDKRNGYVFVINPNGARADVLITDEGRGFNRDWNGIWDAEVLKTDSGWFGEIVIPFSTMKYKNSDEHIWGINFERNVRRKGEAVFWQGWSRNYDFEHVSHAGTLLGLENISGKESIEFKPYLSGGFAYSSENEYQTKTKIGADAAYHVTPTLKLVMTANTDFAQVESDNVQVNMSRFSIYYPEKREFFLDGKDMFEFNMEQNTNIFYSRRIGIAGGTEVPIMGGVKLSGKTGNTNLGILSIQTDETQEAPSTNYTIARVKQDIWDKSSIGGIITARNTAHGSNYVVGSDFEYSTSSLPGGKNLRLKAMAAQSYSPQDNGGENTAYMFSAFFPNDINEGGMVYQVVPKNFNPKSGFLMRENFKNFLIYHYYKPRVDGIIPYIRQFQFKLVDVSAFWTNSTNEMESMTIGFKPLGFTTNTNEYFSFNINREFDRVDNSFNLADSIKIESGKYWFTRGSLYFSTYDGRKISFISEYSFGDYYGGETHSLYNEIKLNAGSKLNISAMYKISNGQFGDKKLKVNQTYLKAAYAFNPKLNTSIFGQWNSEMDQIILNLRLSWIPQIGSDFYLAVNQAIGTDSVIKLKNTVVLAKLVWRFSA